MKTVYQCEICGSTYLTEYYAKQCEANELPPKPDIVVGKNYRELGCYGTGTAVEVRLVALKTNQHIDYKSSIEYYVGHEWAVVFDHSLRNTNFEQYLVSPNRLTDRLLDE